MPDLPELYEALDDVLGALLANEFSTYTQFEIAARIEALCAAIEVKQSQELHEWMNKSTTPEAEALWDRIDKLTWEIPSEEEK